MPLRSISGTTSASRAAPGAGCPTRLTRLPGCVPERLHASVRARRRRAHCPAACVYAPCVAPVRDALPQRVRRWHRGMPMKWYVRLTWWLLRTLGALPLPLLYALGTALGRALWWRRHARERVHTEVNMGIVHPELDAAARAVLVRACLAETGRAVTEMAAVWGRGARRALQLVHEVQGQAYFDAALQSGRGLIIAAPHLGCWELLNYWLCARTPIAILYAPPRNPAWEALLVRARGGLAPEQVRADGAGVRRLYKRLAAGGVVGILPDQQPKRGEGHFAPFFGLAANTMVLLPRIAQRTGATVLFAFAERLPRGAGFRVHILPAPPGIADADLEVACGALNRGVEACVKLAFPQYQWVYKRWAERPDPQAHDPYWLARHGLTEASARARNLRNRTGPPPR
ncbi:MAG TPA: lipid A biosynthesis acyltransferase [Rhodanobacteraceae bacterium]